jgi:hypothetical protein
MPLRDGSSIGLFDSHRSLADGVVSVIDDYQTLNVRHERAFAACQHRFDWPRIGRHLIARIGQVERRRGAPASAAASHQPVAAELG